MAEKQVSFWEYEARQQAEDMPNMHIHSHNELYFLESGMRRYFIGHTIFDVTPGNLVLIPAGQLHRTTAPDRLGYSRYLVSFSEDWVQPIIAAIGRGAWQSLLQRGCIQLPAGEVHRVRKDLEQMGQLFGSGVPYEKAQLGHLLQDILLSALCQGRQKAPLCGESADKIQEVARFITENYAQSLTLEDAARMACMERTYFSKRFRKLTGVGFHEYLTEVRLREAQHLLRETQLTVTEIAERCGFSGGNYFADVLRAHTGLSPSAYRKHHRTG